VIARRSVWNDPKVLELVSKFVPAADEVHRLQSGSDAECRLFQKIAEQGHYAGRTRPSNTRQGTYAAAPSGVMLASINSNDPVRIADMLQRALAKWETMSRAERLLPEDPQSQTSTLQRAERFYPTDGLVLRVNSRDLPRETQTVDWRGKAWNQDFAWFKKEEAKQFLPPLQKGEKQDVPAPIIRRIARCHLVDNVRGQVLSFDDSHVEKARLTTEVTAVEGDVVSLRLEGETRTSAEGTWSVNGYRDMNNPTPQKRGYEARLMGKATYDTKKERFLTFEMVAVGTRWGGTQYNGRGDDLNPAPMGVLFTLAGDSPAERVAPAFFGRAYGWERR
jgi:hypothetical protein